MQSPRVSVPDQVESLASRNTSGITTTQASSRSLGRVALPARSLAQPAPRCRATGQLAWTGPGRSCSFSSEAVACGGPAISKGNSGGSRRPRTGRNCLRMLTKLKRRRPWHIPAQANRSDRPFATRWHVISTSFIGADMQQSCSITTQVLHIHKD